jgi:hypothetical protein
MRVEWIVVANDAAGRDVTRKGGQERGASCDRIWPSTRRGRRTVSLTLRESQAVNELASHLYSFLPGTAHPYANQAISFAGVARDLRLGRYWTGGSKLPAISQLLEATLDRERGRFCDLVLEAVRRGMQYRMNRGAPITREEIDALNELVAGVGFKIPELHDPEFLKSLPREPGPEEPVQTAAGAPLGQLRERFREVMALTAEPRGHAFEGFLNELFAAFDLAPRAPFRLTGEQIDGSFQFQGETYLLEATWQGKRVGEEELNAFSGKVGGKAEWSRGLHVSYSGYTKQGLEGFARGKQTNIVCMDGLDVNEILDRSLDLHDVVERKVRRAAETNEAYVPVRELFP